MASYYLTVKPVSRGAGRSATPTSAYRSASIVYDRNREPKQASRGGLTNVHYRGNVIQWR